MTSHLRQRNAESSTALSPGAIAGIACGSGAIFIGAAGLFILYWRRNRQFDREDDLYRTDSEEDVSRGAAIPAVSYTLDYKMNSPQQHHQHREDSGSYSYSPEKAAYPFSPLSTSSNSGQGSAMPTHPAYIPRAMVRGTPVSNHSSPQPTPPFNFSHQQQQDPSSTFHPDPTQDDTTQPPRSQRPSPLNLNTFTSPSSSPGYLSSSSSSQQQRKQPPRLNLLSTTNSLPLPGKQNTTISGPLAFPNHYQPPPGLPSPPQPSHRKPSRKKKKEKNPHDQIYDDDSTDVETPDGGKEMESYEESDIQYYHQHHHHLHQQQQQQPDKRTFRERSLSGSGGGTYSQPGSQPNSGGLPPPPPQQEQKKSRRRRSSSQQRGNRHYAEIEIGRGSDIW
ncbi:hypothetical protein QBC40DRAFT_288461 [Triangularia verruculosa]|uniref:Uncharacterized protein n=1 Tax=Triangularia verruculosa TaxID=2587418 RepID=A0AAN6X7Z5_9PEZI|nr:hypothetical protein QBC40DRAFT_288461 [Triangularia verruculosa]